MPSSQPGGDSVVRKRSRSILEERGTLEMETNPHSSGLQERIHCDSFTIGFRETQRDVLRFATRLERYCLEQYLQRRQRHHEVGEEEGSTDHEEDHGESDMDMPNVNALKRPKYCVPYGKIFKGNENEFQRQLIRDILGLRRENSILRKVIGSDQLNDVGCNVATSPS